MHVFSVLDGIDLVFKRIHLRFQLVVENHQIVHVLALLVQVLDHLVELFGYFRKHLVIAQLVAVDGRQNHLHVVAKRRYVRCGLVHALLLTISS